MEYLFVLGVIGFCIVSRGFRILTFVVVGAFALFWGVVLWQGVFNSPASWERASTPALSAAPKPGVPPARIIDPFEAAGFTDEGPNSDAKPRQLRQR
jgi:hypothetical protein